MTTFDVEPWERNVITHASDRLNGPREAWWFTGKLPFPGECPGVEENGRITSLPLPNLAECDRETVLDYFDNSWALHEVLFAGLQGAEAFYRPPAHNLRHPMIFYYGHPAVLYVNKLRVSGLLDGPVDAYLEQVLETGVDEMSWDDLSKNDMLWPSVEEVHAYQGKVRRLVRDIIAATPFAAELGRPITQDDRAWALFLAFEHSRIHLETSSVLIRELPLRLVSAHPAWPAPAPMRRTTTTGRPDPGAVPDNPLVVFSATRVRLGKPADFPSFGWDNEYGTRTVDVRGFEASSCLVSNGEYYRFVADGGYRRPELWSVEGWDWRAFGNVKWPRFWVPDGPSGLHAYRLRTLFDEIDMPWDWPVCVNHHEAKAYCTWRGIQDDRGYRLPTEAEHRVIRQLPLSPGVPDDLVMDADGARLREKGINLNLAWGSESPVDHAPASPAGVRDAAGNLWEWSEDTFNPLESFAVHPYYEDFSTPCFDGKHHLILGGAYVSTGDEASLWARFHFRPHFLQHSGIRLIAPSRDAVPLTPDTTHNTAQDTTSSHRTQEALDRHLLMHFGSAEETFGAPGHLLAPAHGYPTRLARLLTREANRAGAGLRRVLEVGCAVGAGSFALAEAGVHSVIGVDPDPRYVETARRLSLGEPVPYERVEQGESVTPLEARAPLPALGCAVEFQVADGSRLPAALGRFDAVLLADLLDPVADPAALLRQFTDSDRFLATGGLLLVAGPWSWQPDSAPPGSRLGGRLQSPTSETALRQLLGQAFDPTAESDEPGVLRYHRRRYEVFSADVSLWRKR